MFERDYLDGKFVALSVSDSADLSVMGFTQVHLSDAFVELCRHLLADGASLIYGGDLRVGGFTELLFELIERYRPQATLDTPVFSNILPWPVHMQFSDEELRDRRSELPRSTKIVCLDRNGSETRSDVAPERTESRSYPREPDEGDWDEGLTTMRATTSEKADARVILGGKIAGYKGSMPGIAEEAMFTLKMERPLFVVGGFGGCSADICSALGLLPDRQTTEWPGLDIFRSGPIELRNGLNRRENELLARTPHIDEAITLILRGVSRIVGGPSVSKL